MMKVKLLVLAITLMPIFNSTAQVEITLDSLDGVTVNGTEVLYESNVSTTGEHMYDFYVTNNTGTDQNFKISRKSIVEPTDWSNYICWDICYIPSSLELWTSSPYNVIAGESKYFSTYVTSPSFDNAHYRYYISTDGINFIDSVDVKISTNSLSLNENKESLFSVFPSPASNTIFISNDSESMAHFYLVDNSGKRILSKTINGLKTSVDISTLNPGMYFYSIFDSENRRLLTRKLIVK